jgi:hypothetical protein
MKKTWKKIIEEYYKNNSKLGRAKIFETFFALGVPKSTLNRVFGEWKKSSPQEGVRSTGYKREYCKDTTKIQS